MMFLAGLVTGGALVALAIYFWPKIETEQRDLQQKAGAAIKSEVTSVTDKVKAKL